MLIVYDIFDDHRRDHLRALLTPLADRIQQSSWIVPAHVGVEPHRFVEALSVATASVDRLRAYAPCPTCVINSRWLPDNQPHRLKLPRVWTVE